MNRKLFKLIAIHNYQLKKTDWENQISVLVTTFILLSHYKGGGVWLQHFLRSSVTLQQPLPIIRPTIEWKVDLLTIYLLMFPWNYLCKCSWNPSIIVLGSLKYCSYKKIFAVKMKLKDFMYLFCNISHILCCKNNQEFSVKHWISLGCTAFGKHKVFWNQQEY